MESLIKNIIQSIGMDTPTLVPLWSMILRSTIIYFIGIFVTRFNKKLIGIRTPFNFILFVMLGSIFATAIMDANLFLPIIGTILFLTFLNRAITILSFFYPKIEYTIKGSPTVLVKNGEIQPDALQRNFITQRELHNELYAQLHVDNLKEIDFAIIESSGTIHFIKKKDNNLSSKQPARYR